MKLSVLKRVILCTVPFLVLLLTVSRATAQAPVDVAGQWSTLPYLMTINPVHVALMNNGKVLVVSGSGNDATNTNLRAAVWDPIAGSITVQTVAWDMFCNGMVVLPDGRPFIVGGTLQYDPFWGQPKASVFDPTTNTFTDVQNMAHGRWYPSATTLGDGRVMTFSGANETGGGNKAVEIYTVGSGWSAEFVANWTPDLYPRMHLLPNGKVFYSGAAVTSRMFDPTAHTWTTVGNHIYGNTRTYGTSVLLPLTPANGYNPKVIIMGGGSPATKTTETIDLGAATPAWAQGPPMSQERIEMNAVILPNGKVLAVGGSLNDEQASTASLNADLYNPADNTFATMAPNVYPRLYHSNALLLPDATVWFTGGNPARGTYEQHMEIYKPGYLFNSDGTPATRPTISGAPPAIAWAGSFTVSTPDAANISSVVLVRPGAPTHAFDMDQRLVGLSFTKGSGTLTVTAPPNGNIAPPGYYMLFLLNSSGVPSVAKFTKLSATASAPAPTVISTTPNSGSTSGAAGVSITGTGFLAGATVSLGGAAATGVTVVNSTTITATTPAHAAGPVSVVVTNTDAQFGTLTNGYTYVAANPQPTVTSITPNSGSVNGATSVNISGTGFLAGATVKLGGTLATGVTVLNSTTISATTPAHAAGAVSVVVTNTDAQSGTLNNGYTYTTSTGVGSIAFVQVNAGTPQTPASSVAVAYPLAQTAGNLNIVVVGWNDTSSTLTSLTDSRGNTYAQAGTTITGPGIRQAIFYAKNIAAGSNTVTAIFNQAALYVDVRVLEYSGLDTTNPFDVAAGSSGTGVNASSGAATTTTANELIFGSGTTGGGFGSPGTGFASRITTQDGDIAEDRLVTVTGSNSATAVLRYSSTWVMQMATFRASGQTTPPSNPAPTVSSISPNTGTANGGTSVNITGTGFLAGASVTLGGISATVLTVGSTSITATTPAHAAGAVSVVVTNTDGQSGSLANGYTYTPNPAPTVASITPNTGTASGGTSVNITGTGFQSGATVKLGGTLATGVTVLNSTTISAVTPAHAAGAVSVVVTNGDAQFGTLTNGYTYTTPTGVGSIVFVQVNAGTPQTPSASVAVAYPAAQTAGNLNIVVVGWNDTSATLTSLTDSRGNSYTQAGTTITGPGIRQALFYAKNIAGGSNTVTALFNQAALYVDVRVLEYSGLDTTNPFDVAAGSSGTSATASSGAATTTSANDLIFASGTTGGSFGAPGTGFASRITTQDGDIAQDQLVSGTGSYSASAALRYSSTWVMQMATFRASGQTGPPSNPAPTVTSISPNTGTANGGTSVTITGTGFLAGATVTMGGISATVLTVGSTSITATTPAHAAGAVNVVVTNTDGQSGPLTNGFTYTTTTGGGPIAFVQVNAGTPQVPSASVAVTYPLAQTAGNLNIVVVGWNDTSSTLTSLTDSRGNSYAQAGTTITGPGIRQGIYYAKNILGGSNTVTAVFNQAAAYVDVRVLEYSGLDTTNPFDVAAGSSGTSANASSGAATTTTANELIFGSGTTGGGFGGPGTGFVSRITTQDGDIVEDQLVTAPGSYSAAAVLRYSSTWVMQMATFRAKP